MPILAGNRSRSRRLSRSRSIVSSRAVTRAPCARRSPNFATKRSSYAPSRSSGRSSTRPRRSPPRRTQRTPRPRTEHTMRDCPRTARPPSVDSPSRHSCRSVRALRARAWSFGAGIRYSPRSCARHRTSSADRGQVISYPAGPARRFVVGRRRRAVVGSVSAPDQKSVRPVRSCSSSEASSSPSAIHRLSAAKLQAR